MATLDCHPCKDQNKEIVASFWCMFCEELLCEPCHKYHKALKVTKSHVTVTCEEYNSFSDFLVSLQTKCKNHHEREIEYVCKGHKSVFCFLCKRNEHNDCKYIEVIEDISEIDLYCKLETFAGNLKRDIIILDAICNNRRTNIETLHTQHKKCLKDLQEKRMEINLALDKLETELKSKFEIGCNNAKETIKDDLKVNTLTQQKWEKDYQQLSKIVELKPLSMMQLALANKLVRKDCIQKDAQIKDILKTLSHNSCEFEISVIISESNRSIKINDNMTIVSRLQTLDLVKSSENVVDIKESSAFKYEKSSGTKTPFHKTEQDCDLVKLFDSEHGHCDAASPLEIDKNNSQEKTPCEMEQNNLAQTTRCNKAKKYYKAVKTIDISTHKKGQTLKRPPGKAKISTEKKNESRVAEPFHFDPLNKFMIILKVPQYQIKCMKCLPNGGFILGEGIERRLHIYDKTGSKIGEISLQDDPKEIAIFSEHSVVVTVNKGIVFANFKTFNVLKTIPQDDNCHGITMLGSEIVLNCMFKGLYILGNFCILRHHFNSIVGVLVLTSINPHTVVYSQKDSDLVYFFNIVTNDLAHTKCPGLSGATSITSDTEGNVYVACQKTNKIHMYQKKSGLWQNILTERDGIDNPLSVDYSNGMLYVINKNSSICIYKRNNASK